MSQRPATSESAALRGPKGDLVFVRVSVPQRLLEDALELLSQASFPVNPEIRHANSNSVVEFPAYDADVEEIRRLLKDGGLYSGAIDIANALSAISE